ncbi:MAG: signal recognition particle protein [Peptococcaceae bacterium]|jgi:signal recognition particle subunit SRP54|nr:signal recognition particle protein [Peptococcaceae bacterium]
MFANLTEKLQETFKKLRNKGRLTEADVDLALREVKLALLAADVNLKVVKEFLARVRERAVGQDVLTSLSPAQQVIKVVFEELTSLMGEENARLNLGGRSPHVIMLVGLQGSGKTTTAAKLANFLKGQGRQPLLVAADVQRPAAIKQLEVLGQQLGFPVFSLGTGASPPAIAAAAVKTALAGGRDVVIIDTAGRVHVDEDLMTELAEVYRAASPEEVLLVVDAMTGQVAVEVAGAFAARSKLTGLVLTKLDGDSRGGAVLSVRSVTGCPVKFVGMGEKTDALEPFHPDRMARRILGMGDMLTLIEKAQENFDVAQMEAMQKKIRSADFTLEDLLDQMQSLKKVGPLDQVMAMIPGLSGLKKNLPAQVGEKELGRLEAVIRSMTPQERMHPQTIDGGRKRRIARGSGTAVQDVNRVLKQFEQYRKMMKQVAGMERGWKRSGRMPKMPF